MSNIGPGIAGSVSQAAVQQSQIARQRDAVRNQDARRAEKMRELLEKHTHEVEDSAEADSNRVPVHEEQRGDPGRQRRKREAHELTTDPDPPAGEGLDVEA